MKTGAVRTEPFDRETPLHRRKQDFYGFESTTAGLSSTLIASRLVEIKFLSNFKPRGSKSTISFKICPESVLVNLVDLVRKHHP